MTTHEQIPSFLAEMPAPALAAYMNPTITPKQLPSGLPRVMPWRDELLPTALREYVRDVAERSQVRDEFEAVISQSRPLLLDCPVQFPAGGGCTLTFPVAKGDECLVVFSSRCIDAWWQSGGIQVQAELRMHDMSDGFALLGFRSLPRMIPGISTSAVQLRSDHSSAFIEVNPTSHA
ncbi:hypothetical protein L2088_00345 [Pseudomonas protegens]|uniref:Gp138 family membrane-puncturing spike protein n=1 Tax=Pseudomonas protegens TaxID=380021 RepID=UPI002024CB5C|nr:Gp138 family membrane-puncturing spike protein [Pseudomonas protegens]MCL9653139.1 hypothetical protein [Pseudomonas protegens]